MSWNDGDIAPYAPFAEASVQFGEALDRLPYDSEDFLSLRNFTARKNMPDDELRKEITQNRLKWKKLTAKVATTIRSFWGEIDSLLDYPLKNKKIELSSEELALCGTFQRMGYRALGHLPDLWDLKPTGKNELSHEEIRLELNKTFDLIPDKTNPSHESIIPHIFQKFIKMHWNNTNEGDNLTEEQAQGLMLRILSETDKPNPMVARLMAQNSTIKSQLQLIDWKHYVKVNGILRNKERPALDLVHEWRGRKAPALQITGDGGMGKTKLAYEFIKSCLEEEDVEGFDTIIFLTAKSDTQGEFTPKGIRKPGSQTISSPRDPTIALGTYIPGLSYEMCIEHYKAVFGVNDEWKLNNCFTENNVLVVLDNFEDVSEEEAEQHLEFITETLDTNKSKFLITGRSKVVDGWDVQTLQLGNLTPQQASELVGKRYNYMFENLYSHGGVLPRQYDLSKPMSEPETRKKLLDSIADEIKENSDEATINAFTIGQHHPLVLFWILSLLMDPDIFEEAKKILHNEAKDAEINFSETVNVVAMFKFVVEHEEYGLKDFIDEWENWIRNKSKIYLNNDPNCMLVLRELAKKYPSLVYESTIFDTLQQGHGISRTILANAFNKILAQPGVLEQHTEKRMFKLTPKAMDRFDLHESEPEGSAGEKFDALAKEIHEFTMTGSGTPEDFKKIVEEVHTQITKIELSEYDGKKASIKLLQSIVYCYREIHKEGKFPAYGDRIYEEILLMFDNIRNRFIPNNEKKKGAEKWWVKEDVKDFIQTVSGEPTSLTGEADLLRQAEALIHNPRRYKELRQNSDFEYYLGSLPVAFCEILSISKMPAEFIKLMDSHGYLLLYFGPNETGQFLQDVAYPSNTHLDNMKEILTEDQLISLYPLFFRSTELIDNRDRKNEMILERYITGVIAVLKSGNIHSLLEKISNKYTTLQTKPGEIFVTFQTTLNHLRLEQNVNRAVAHLYHLFDQLPPRPKTESPNPYQEFGRAKLTRWNTDLGMPHDYRHYKQLYLNERKEQVKADEVSQQGAFVLDSYNPKVECYTFLYLENFETESSIESLDRPSEPSNTENDGGHSNESPPHSLEETHERPTPDSGHSQEIAKQSNDTRDIARDLVKYFDGHMFTRVFYRDVINDNNISDCHDPVFWRDIFKKTEKDWDILFSAYDKEVIVSFDNYKPKTVHPRRPKLSKKSSKKDRYLEWFERSKHGMHHDHKKAVEIIQPLVGQLASRSLDATKQPVLFANSFVQSLAKNPYSSKNQLATSMRWYAAFHYALNKGSKDTVCDIINWYARELNRQLPYAELTRDEVKLWESKNHEWINALRIHFGCDKKERLRMNHKQKRKERRKLAAQREKQKKAEQRSQKKHDEEAYQHMLDRRKAIEEAAEKRRQEAEKRRQERVRQRLERDMGHINQHMGAVLAAIETLLQGDEKQALKKIPGISDIFFTLFHATGNLEGTWYKFITNCDHYIQTREHTQINEFTAEALLCVQSVLSQLGASKNQIAKWESEWQ